METPKLDSTHIVRIQDAQSRDGSSGTATLESFMAGCEEYFVWSGCLVDQEYQTRLADGMIRCYFSHDEVVGFARQWPKGLLDLEPGEALADAPTSVMEGPEAPCYQALRVRAEEEWMPQMKAILGLERESLPIVWDADFLFGPRDEAGEDTYILCEINVSAVWPFPSPAVDKVAAAALARVQSARASRKNREHSAP